MILPYYHINGIFHGYYMVLYIYPINVYVYHIIPFISHGDLVIYPEAIRGTLQDVVDGWRHTAGPPVPMLRNEPWQRSMRLFGDDSPCHACGHTMRSHFNLSIYIYIYIYYMYLNIYIYTYIYIYIMIMELESLMIYYSIFSHFSS